MQKTSIKKLSFLGFVLIAASAVTAAVAPDKKPDKEDNVNNGSLRQEGTSDGDYSCVPNTPATGATCTLTEMSETTEGMIDGSSVTLQEGIRDTVGNTSLTGLGGADSAGGA